MHICVGKLTIIASDNSLSPGRHQAIIWTNAGILLIWPLGTNFSEISIEIEIIILIQENAFQNVVCEMVAILSGPLWVKISRWNTQGIYKSGVTFCIEYITIRIPINNVANVHHPSITSQTDLHTDGCAIRNDLPRCIIWCFSLK